MSGSTPQSDSTPQSVLCLNMIVRNEAAILERCLAAAAPFIGYYVIADTGSTDGTPELIRSFFEARGIPGEIHHTTFEDFGQARNEALELARASKGVFDYLFFADADMELVVDDPSVFSRLTGPAYALKQVSGVSYFNVRLVKRDVPVRYVGATHEFVEVEPGARIEGIWFRDHASGSSRSGKYERDERLLRGALEKAPDDARTLFYLAQTYKDMERWDDARGWYEKRVAAGGWEEERWYARYMIARCYLGLEDNDAFVRAALAAYEARPSRAEPLFMLAQEYRLKRQHALAFLIADAGARIPRPKDDSLFVEDFVYDFGLPQELSISGYYALDPAGKQRGYDACMRLTTSREAPLVVRATAAKNAVFYAKELDAFFPGSSTMELPTAAPPSIGWRGRRWARGTEGRVLVATDDSGDAIVAQNGEGDVAVDGVVAVVRDEDLFLIVSLEPTVVLSVDPETLHATPIARSESKLALAGLRGALQAIPVNRGVLCVAVQTIAIDGRLATTHRLALLDPAFRVIQLSDPFLAKGTCVGLTRVAGSSRFALTFRSDNRTFVTTIDIDEASIAALAT